MKRDLQIFRAYAIIAALSEKTRKNYVKDAISVFKEFGLSYVGVLMYIRSRSRDVGASRLKGIKSAVVFIRRALGFPMSTEESEDLDAVLRGIEVIQAKPRKVRGAPNRNQVTQLVKDALNAGGLRRHKASSSDTDAL